MGIAVAKPTFLHPAGRAMVHKAGGVLNITKQAFETAMTHNLRHYMNLVLEAASGEYPTRSGGSLAAWSDFIVAVMQWKLRRYGSAGFPWKADHGDISPKAGLAALERLANKGIVSFEAGSDRDTARTAYDPFTRSTKSVGGRVHDFWMISPGPNFQQPSEQPEP